MVLSVQVCWADLRVHRKKGEPPCPVSALRGSDLVLVFMARMSVKVRMRVHDAAMGMAMGVNEVCPQKQVRV
jgi:hypothetical protein